MNWIRGHIRILAAVIVIIALLTIIVVSSKTGGGGAAGQAVEGTITVVQEPVSDAGNGIASFFSGLIHFRSIQKENYELKQQIESLGEELVQAQLSQTELQELRSLYNSLNMVSYDDEYTTVTAQVVAMNGSDFFNIFTINAGTADGLSNNDLVLNQDGLVGRITAIGKHWAKVTSIVDSTSSVSFTILRDSAVIGMISGSESGDLSGYVFDEAKSVIEGDTLVTSGLGYYPAGIRIGTVTSVNIDSNTRKKTVTADSAVDFSAVRTVSVLAGTGSVQQRNTVEQEDSDAGEDGEGVEDDKQ